VTPRTTRRRTLEEELKNITHGAARHGTFYPVLALGESAAARKLGLYSIPSESGAAVKIRVIRMTADDDVVRVGLLRASVDNVDLERFSSTRCPSDLGRG
jgi:hypothetical protein